ncbi:MAG: TMEM175 family protein [Bacteroidia bacterium]
MDHKNFLEKFYKNERVEMLSDGVFAIVVTLLILELRVPQLSESHSPDALWIELLKMKSKFISFILSFLFVINLWFSHNVLFRVFVRVDNVMLWLNNLFLLVVCFVPFPTGLIGEYPDSSVAMILFGIPWVLIPVLVYSLGTYAMKKKHLSPLVDMKRYNENSKAVLSFIPIAIIPLLISLKYPEVSFVIYMILLVAGIVLGFRVRLIKGEIE